VEALGAWLEGCFTVGDTTVGGCDYQSGDDVVIYGSGESRFAFKLSLDGERTDGNAIVVTTDMFYREADDGPWLLIDTVQNRGIIEVAVLHVVRDRTAFPSQERVAALHSEKAARALAESLPAWQWLRQSVGGSPVEATSAGNEVVIWTKREEVARLSVEIATGRKAKDSEVLLLTLTMFKHPAVRDWTFLGEPAHWKALQRFLQPRI
jgi:hypothetical protein